MANGTDRGGGSGSTPGVPPRLGSRMAASNHEFVSFDSPPVEEVVFAVQFVDPVISFDHMAQLQRDLRSEFPTQQIQPPLDRMVSKDEVVVSFRVGPPLPRIWWLSADGHRVVQVQEDRVALNWRRLGGWEVRYPRYPQLRGEFIGHLAALRAAVESDVAIDACELSYVNELRLESGGYVGMPPLRRLLRTVLSEQLQGFLGEPEDQQWAARWAIPSVNKEPGGTLEAKVEPVRRRIDGYPTYLLTLTCRMVGDFRLNNNKYIDALDTAHEHIVRGFADLTTEEMHEQWGRTK
jgi:uncharacterized protein (TIGR04255 family)